MKKIILITSLIAITMSSCLKDDKHFVDFANAGNIINMPLSGLANFGSDALTADTNVIEFAVDYATANANTKAVTVTLAIDNTIVDKYNTANPGITYFPVPASAFIFTTTSVTIPAGSQYAFAKLTLYKNLLDPSKSYMLPIKIVSAGGIAISSNSNVHYYHVIGNDFAGAYTYDYRRFQNGTGPGAGAIPSKNQGSPPDITSIGGSTTLFPVSPTEFQMVTNYNGQNVNYDVTFSRTVSGSTVTYSNWNVTFLPGDIAKWTAAGIANLQAPKFTVDPPATSADPKFFELNYISGGAFPRYIDDTYHH